MKRHGCKSCHLLEQYPGQWVNDLCPQCTELAKRNPVPELPAPRLVRTDATAERLRHHLRNMANEIPDVWKTIDRLRSTRGKDGIPNWENWCFLPLAGAYAIVSNGGEMPPDKLPQVGALGALAAWRVTQGIYRYDPTVLDVLWETPVTGDIPEEALRSMPEWCVYIETPGKTFPNGSECFGFFAYLEHDSNTGRRELRLLMDVGNALLGALPIHLGAGLAQGLERALEEAKAQMKAKGIVFNDEARQTLLDTPIFTLSQNAAPYVSVLLYLCAANAEMRDRSERRLRPSKPLAVKTKDGYRIFPPNEPTTWEIGYRIGATIRGAMAEEKRHKEGDGMHASPRPHIRRSHWHSFWTGEKAKPGKGPVDRKLVLKWLPPIPVGTGDVIPTIHKVI